MNKDKEFKRLVNLSDFNLDYESLESEFINLNKLAAKLAGTEISQLNFIDSSFQWSVSQIGTKDLIVQRDETICSYTVEREKPMEVFDLSKDDRFMNIESIKAAGAKYYYGVPLISKEGFSVGSFCVISLRELTLTDTEKEFINILADDIVSRLESIRVKNKMKKALKDQKTAKREIAHDLRGMINGLIGLGELIQMEYDGNSEEIKKYLTLLKKSGKEMLSYSENVLSNQLEEEEIEDDTISTKALVEKIKRLYLPLSLKKGVSLNISHSGDSNSYSIDDGKILQIVGNLISNAIKFTEPKKSVDVHFEILNSDSQKDTFKNKSLKITVKDSGVGMSESKVSEIIENKVTSTKGTNGEGGYGLGLSLVQHHIKELDGNLETTSKEGIGSEFKVVFSID